MKPNLPFQSTDHANPAHLTAMRACLKSRSRREEALNSDDHRPCASGIFRALAATRLRSAEFIPPQAAIINRKRNKFRAPEISKRRTLLPRQRNIPADCCHNWLPAAWTTPTGLCRAPAAMLQPRWGCLISSQFPRVARNSQHRCWALSRNPFGIHLWNSRKAIRLSKQP